MARQLTKEDRGRVAEKIMEWGNLVFVTSSVGQFVSPQPFNRPLAIIGAVLTLLAYTMALRIMKGGRRL